MHSRAHRAVSLDPRFRDPGVGVATTTPRGPLPPDGAIQGFSLMAGIPASVRTTGMFPTTFRTDSLRRRKPARRYRRDPFLNRPRDGFIDTDARRTALGGLA